MAKGIVLKIVARKSWLILLWGVSVTMVLLMVGQFALLSMVVWLGTPAGQNRVRELMPDVIAQIPYEVSFDTKDLPDQRLGIDLSARIMDRLIEAKARLYYAGSTIKIESFSAQAPDLKIKGSGAYNVNNKSLTASLSGTLDSLHSYPELVSGNHNVAPLSFNLNISQDKARGLTVAFDVTTKEYSNKVINLTSHDVVLKGDYADGVVIITSLTAHDHDKGTTSAAGTFGLKNKEADIKITARDMNLIKGDIASGVFDGDLTFQGKTKEGYLVAGEVAAQKLDITIPERISGKVPQLNVTVQGQAASTPSSVAKNIKLDIKLNAPQRIMVRGWGVDAEFGGALDVKGTAKEPLFFGSLEMLRGRYSEFGKLFKITGAKLNFSGSVPPSPDLDIQAKTKAGDITAIINISGSVMSPKIGFSSEPALPEDEVLSHILFGNGMESLSPFQAVQLAQALRRFSGQGGGAGGLDPIGALRNITGLDELHFETDEEGAASVGAGKYLTDKVYLEFESGTEEGSGTANVEIELSPNVTLESEIGQDASGGVGIFWKRDY